MHALVMDTDEVLDTTSAAAPINRSTCFKIFVFRPKSSLAASITTSAGLRSS
jgi:hypothetical protein